MQFLGRRTAPALVAVAGLMIAVVVGVSSRARADVSPATSRPAAVTKTVMLVGDSVPKSFAGDFAVEAAKHGYTLVSAAVGGCPATGVGKIRPTGQRFKRNTCPKVVGRQDRMIQTYDPALVIWWSRYEVAPRLGSEGKVLRLGSRAYERVQQASFNERVRALTSRGARLVAVQIEPPGPVLAVRNPSVRSFLIGQTLLHRRDVLNTWNAFLASHKGPTVFSVSVTHLICHDSKDPCDDRLPSGATARPDGIHYSDAARRLLAPPIFDAVWRAARLG